MTRITLPLILTIALALVCVAADYLLKRASATEHPFTTHWFAVGCLLYVISAVGWVTVFRHAKLATVGAVFSIVVVILLAVVGVFAFHENLSAKEVLGLACAVAALTLLGRFV